MTARCRGDRAGGRERGHIGWERRGKEYILQKIRDNMEEFIATLSEDDMRDLLQQVVVRDLGLMFDLLNEVCLNPYDGYHLRPRTGDKFLRWCICGNCREMPSEQENVCCKRNPEDCISGSLDFELRVLNDNILPLSKQRRKGHFVLKNENKIKRRTSYRQYILWRYGKLGPGVRRVIPSCCVWKIRDTFTDPFNNYTGFMPARLG